MKDWLRITAEIQVIIKEELGATPTLKTEIGNIVMLSPVLKRQVIPSCMICFPPHDRLSFVPIFPLSVCPFVPIFRLSLCT